MSWFYRQFVIETEPLKALLQKTPGQYGIIWEEQQRKPFLFVQLSCSSLHYPLSVSLSLSLIHTYTHTQFLTAWSSTLLISLGHTQCSRFYCYGLLNSMMERPSWGWHLFCRPSQMDTCAKLTKADDFCRAEYICWKGQIDLGIIYCLL